ncbi:VOC family protein [Acetobacteraceae bacterium KSS8]|uniref:2-oxoadipate dioxygenase/decarboxylase n=1 Tax=Endosaccharibacter trunci TaxID=2812733 RepID=A0ABT1W5H5_9PROT|nr:VOC family protein [Acetobacteraceae bacterium KSS8]
MSDAVLLDPVLLRDRFSQALSAMYRQEVPLYGDLLRIVADTNRAAGGADDQRLGSERHGAIRVGTAAELRLIARLFAVMGMRPVGYYDLASAGVPVHSTAFRPVRIADLDRSPFRVFTSLLRPELIADAALREEALAILAARRLGSDRLDALLARAEAEGGLPAEDAPALIAEALSLFRWHDSATVSAALYARLRAAHPLVADVVCFRGPHINHLTPRTLDIDAAQAAMRAAGMNPKAVIEGPPRRKAPILLRQTSFQALSETVRFSDAPGTHTARFGEIEQRGTALTPAGRALYDAALDRLQAERAAGRSRDEAEAISFAALPDDPDALRETGLAFFDRRTGLPLLYEDFLPVSAAGIFRSNLGSEAGENGLEAGTRAALEDAIGTRLLDEMALYAAQADGRDDFS